MGDIGERRAGCLPFAAEPALDAAAAQAQFATAVKAEQCRGDGQHLVAQRLGGEQEHAAARGAAAGAAAAHAVGRGVGVAEMNTNIGGIDAKRLRYYLSEGGLVALSGAHQTDRGVDRARRLDFHPARLVTGAGNAGRLVEGGTVGGRLDDAAHAEAAMDAAGAVARLAFAASG